ncbi:hypothetical protein D7X74_04920 [Corallococcus sp. CA047B]|uniref:tyrosine-type recombinase/integrase n=1 Tax=Corallococcus sp. CA047B TaxID=2316729 RepID=UPI000EA12B4C|nr:tyrosine-type recombinase/integrase [Corallococcus sp. CA047B]RKH20143.1 hypothetical protein D7X74_04920 [Corallococcus sp. CA047B]
MTKWSGGRTYTATDGSARWIIRKTVAGVAHNVTLDVRSEAEALAELAAFRRNPAAYRTASQERQDEAQQAQEDAAQAVFLDEDRARRFLQHLKASGRSDEYLKSTRSYLAAWATALADKDLRAVTGPALKKTLATWDTGKKWRIIVFKSFTSFLQDAGELDPMVNPGRFLKVPPARRNHELKGYSIEHVQKLYAALGSQAIRDVLCLQAKTGMHGTEVNRLASGDGKITVLKDQGEIAATVTFKHKTGKRFTLSLDAQGLAAAKRLQARGSAPDRQTIREAVERVGARTGLEFIHFGAIRHSFATWLVERGRIYNPKGGGLSLEAVAQALNHSSTRTTALHYVSATVPPMYVVPIRLEHPEDPIAIQAMQTTSDRIQMQPHAP